MHTRVGLITSACLSFLFLLIIPTAAYSTTATTMLTPTPYLLESSFLPVVAKAFSVIPTLPTAVPPTSTTVPTQTPTMTSSPTAVPTSTAVATQTPTVTATPTLTHTPLPTATNLPTSTATPTNTVTPTNTATFSPQSTTGNVRILEILYNGYVPLAESDEYVAIKNFDTHVVLLGGWQLVDGDGDPAVTLPPFEMQPNQVCRIYTDQNHPEWCGFSFEHGSAIWNNGGDSAVLKNSNGLVTDTCEYLGGGSDGDIAHCE